MRADLVAVGVATLTSISVVPAVVALIVDAHRSWRTAKHYPNGRREVALALLRSAWLRGAKAMVTLAMVAGAWVILWEAAPPVKVEVVAFLWLLALASALTWVDVAWTHLVRRSLYRQALAERQAKVRRLRRTGGLR